MNEYGIKESWTKSFVILHLVIARNFQTIRLMGIGEILVLWDDHALVSYNPNDPGEEGGGISSSMGMLSNNIL